ncbi:hypothetical protein pb186bvf_018974 [Paramecium bursaria]
MSDIYENPDGSLIQLEPYQDTCIKITHRNQEDDEDDIALPPLVNSYLEMMVKQQQTVLMIVILHMVFNTLFTALGLYFRQDTINKLNNLFDDQDRAYQLYWILSTIDICSCVIYYFLTIKSYLTKSYYMYQLLIKWVYICFFIQVFLAYINKLNYLLVLLKILTYIYSKFVAQLIKGFVNLPRFSLD